MWPWKQLRHLGIVEHQISAHASCHRQPRGIAVLLCLIALGLAACERHVSIKEEMTWECAPDHYMPQYPEAQPVRFRFVADPHYEDVVSGRGLCDQLKRSGEKIVVVEFEAWGDSVHGLSGYRELAVSGTPIVDVGGFGSSGATNPTGPHPLAKLFKPGK
jgi:hypothetical protein